MSRIGLKPIEIKEKAEVVIDNRTIKVKGPKGELVFTHHPLVKLERKDNVLYVKRLSEQKLAKSLHGTTRQIIFNMLKGVTEGFKKELLIEGIGYRASMRGKELVLQVGFSHPLVYTPPEGVEIKVEGNKIEVSGIDKQLVGDVSATIRSLKPPEPYKGKGIRYIDEVVRKKAGKTAIKAE